MTTVKPISNEAGVFRGSPVIRGLSRTSVLVANAAVASMFLTAYVALEWVSFIHEHKGLTITPWNPGLGVVFALMVLVGSRAGFILFTGVVAAEIFVLQSNLEWPIVIGVGAITSLSYAFVAAVARRNLRLDVRLVHLRDVLVLLAVGLAGAAIDTVLLTVFLLAFGQLEMRDVASASVPLLVGEIIGIAVMTPLLLRFVFRRREIVPRRLTCGRNWPTAAPKPSVRFRRAADDGAYPNYPLAPPAGPSVGRLGDLWFPAGTARALSVGRVDVLFCGFSVLCHYQTTH